MNKKTKIIIAIVLVLAVLIGIFLALTNLNNDKQEEPKNVNEESEIEDKNNKETEAALENTDKPANQEEPIVYSFNEEEEAQREINKEDLKQMAFAISERFGSYSNEGNYGNISDLKIYMTENMKTWAENYIAENSDNDYSGSYYGITTTALVGEITEFDSDEVSITVTTKRKEVENSQENIFNQDIIINFKKVGDEYKVDGAYWQ
ncbi:ABC transporter permease [Patescibacteria group bacterium]|nr:ABC transporter permease [Patescibacteria group bacterium]